LGKKFNILIADRNPHVREFLKRELTAAGFQVRVAENTRKVMKLVDEPENTDLLIMDPDLPGTDSISLLLRLKGRTVYIPVIIHTFLADFCDCEIEPDMLNIIAFVEKGGSSVETLKEVIFSVLDASSHGIQAENTGKNSKAGFPS